MFNQAKTNAIVALSEELVANVPCTGISIGRFEDKSTYKVDFLPDATQEHMVLAELIIDAFNNNV